MPEARPVSAGARRSGSPLSASTFGAEGGSWRSLSAKMAVSRGPGSEDDSCRWRTSMLKSICVLKVTAKSGPRRFRRGMARRSGRNCARPGTYARYRVPPADQEARLVANAAQFLANLVLIRVEKRGKARIFRSPRLAEWGQRCRPEECGAQPGDFGSFLAASGRTWGSI